MANENDYLIIVKKECSNLITEMLRQYIDIEESLIVVPKQDYVFFIVCGQFSKLNNILKKELDKFNIPYYFRSNYTVCGKEDYYEDIKYAVEKFDLDFLRNYDCVKNKKAYKDVSMNQVI